MPRLSSSVDLVEHHGSGMQPSFRLREEVTSDGQHTLVIIVSSPGQPDRSYRIREATELALEAIEAGRAADAQEGEDE